MNKAEKRLAAFADDYYLINLNIFGSDSIGDKRGEEIAVQCDGSDVLIEKTRLSFLEDRKTLSIYLKEKIDVKKNYRVFYPGYGTVWVMMRKILDNEEYIYNGDDLGCNYTPEKTSFRVWAPTANRVELVLYANGNDHEGRKFEMSPNVNGTWVIEIYEDLRNKFYTYSIQVGGQVNEAVDPYVKSVNINGTKGAIVDLLETDPGGWDMDVRPPFKNFVDAIIYETHIRDLTIAANSGIKDRGKFLGLAEEETRSPDGFYTGLAHLKELGITHLHLLPIMESEFIIDDEDHYNWGYGTNFFFATEGQYVTDPGDPVKRINEFKQAVLTLHRNGIRVVLDVVYNHLGRIDPDLERIVPGYYLRRNEKGELYCGSGVNNDFASERPMARKLMIDSLKYWVKEYHVDGFRFDLMGLHDKETMLLAVKELHQIDPTILIYGEPWLLPTGLPFEKLMVKNAQKGTPIAIFNDNVRDAIASGGMAPVTDRGFVSGKRGLEAAIKKAVVGSIIDYDPERVYNEEYRLKPSYETIHTFAPHETINYVTSHDNYALRDRLEKSNPEATEKEREKMALLANGIILTCQGIPFLAGGVEIHKTKFGDENSYRSPDYINEIDWSYKKRYYRMFKFYQGLISLRKNHPAFRMTTAEDIKNNLSFYESPEGTVVFSLNNHANGDLWKTIIIIYNRNRYSVSLNLPEKGWNVVVKENKAGIEPIEEILEDNISVPPISMMVLYR